MTSAIASKFHMSCGCTVFLNDLVLQEGIFHCPHHSSFGKINTIEKFCVRCGELMTISSASFRKIFCDDCAQIVSLGRTICSIYGLSEFTDPLLWHKEIDEITDDILFNVCMGYEAIQIDSPRLMQKEDKRVVIDLKKKIKDLRRRNGVFEKE